MEKCRNLEKPYQTSNSPKIFFNYQPTIAKLNIWSRVSANDRLAAGKFREFNFENVKLSTDKSPSPSDVVDLPSPGLGELRHAKSRLTLDLNLPPKPEPAEKLSPPEKCREPETPSHRQRPDDGELLEESSDDFVDDFGGLNYKACDISPVVELKSLTSTSVA